MTTLRIEHAINDDVTWRAAFDSPGLDGQPQARIVETIENTKP